MSTIPTGTMPEQVSHSLVKALRSVPDFAGLDDATLLTIAGASANLFWPAGALIFEKGSVSEALFVVLSGRVLVYKPSEEGDVEVSRLAAGDSFGELSLLLQETHSKSARALEDTELMVLPEESFLELLSSNDELAGQFRRRIEERSPVRGDVHETT
jgi:CRP/FNR family transcriptional regulator, dissimilatory nitrate respiration regulator